MRVSQFKAGAYAYKHAASPETLAGLIEPLVGAGVSRIYASQRRFWEAEFPGSPMNLAGWIRKLSGLPVITVGSVGLSVDTIDTMLDSGEVDLVAVGRALLQDPLWARKIRTGRTGELQVYSIKALDRYY